MKTSQMWFWPEWNRKECGRKEVPHKARGEHDVWQC